MDHLYASAVPADYSKAAKKELRGTLTEIEYPVRHYIDASRQLVSDQHIDAAEAGRAIVSGDAIAKKCNIYLPAGYDPLDDATKYDVVYLLHGVGGDQGEWLTGNQNEDGEMVLCNIVDHLIASGEIKPVIVVFPNGRSAHDWTDRAFNTAGTNLLGFYYFDYELRYDLIPYIESHYRTYADISLTSPDAIDYNHAHRAIAGLSMGGMQALNLILGGYRHDSAEHIATPSREGNGLTSTVRAPGMEDLFAYAGAFSNAPTSSGGDILGESIASRGYKLSLLYMICGDADGISYERYLQSIDGLEKASGDWLEVMRKSVVKDGVHDFRVWNVGAYEFLRLIFRNDSTLR